MYTVLYGKKLEEIANELDKLERKYVEVKVVYTVKDGSWYRALVYYNGKRRD